MFLLLIGIFYRFHPALDASRIARVQPLVWICGTIVLAIGVAGIYLGKPGWEPMAIIDSFLVLGGMLIFAYPVFRTHQAVAGTSATQIAHSHSVDRKDGLSTPRRPSRNVKVAARFY